MCSEGTSLDNCTECFPDYALVYQPENSYCTLPYNYTI